MNYGPVSKWTKIYRAGKWVLAFLVISLSVVVGLGIGSCIK